MLPEPPLSYRRFLALAAADPAVAALVLKGSQAHEGMVGPHSDHDLYVVLADGADSPLLRYRGHRTAELDLVFTTLGEFRRPQGFDRYALARGRIVLDRVDPGETGEGLPEILAAKAHLAPGEAAELAAERLDAYVNALYRSLKNHRDGLPLAARLDAADSARFLLDLLFALDRRPRPFNKYLEWELERHPLPGWPAAVLPEAVGRISATADPVLQRRVFAQVERVARAAGHGAVLDAWGADLELMRG